MNSDELQRLTLIDAARLIRKREISPLDLTRSVLAQIESVDSKVNAFITVTAEQALDAAREAESLISSGEELGPLHGVPVSVKDLIDMRAVATTAGSRIFADRVAEADATIVTRLEAAGAILVGKTNMHEFAYGVTSANVHYGPVRNPWNVERIAGGSSGGSAVSVVLSMSLGSIGTDTGGSIRIPAALCGTVGLKPTHGRVSGAGILPLVESFDTFGPITRTVEDAALMLDVIGGPDPLDPRTLSVPDFEYRASLNAGIQGLRLGVPRDVFDRTDPDVQTLATLAIDVMEDLGADLVEVDLVGQERLEAIFRAITGREVFAFHKEHLERSPSWYGDDTRARIEAGRTVTETDYANAQLELAGLTRQLEACFASVDLLALPTIPIPAPLVGQEQIGIGGKDEPVLMALTRHTRLASITGVPAISLPCGLTRGNLPAGLQLAGPHFSEETILRAARAYEQRSGGLGRPPTL